MWTPVCPVVCSPLSLSAIQPEHIPLCAWQLMVWDPDVNKAIAKVLELEKDIQEHIVIT